jgi:hypothetical protein
MGLSKHAKCLRDSVLTVHFRLASYLKRQAEVLHSAIPVYGLTRLHVTVKYDLVSYRQQ